MIVNIQSLSSLVINRAQMHTNTSQIQTPMAAPQQSRGRRWNRHSVYFFPFLSFHHVLLFLSDEYIFPFFSFKFFFSSSPRVKMNQSLTAKWLSTSVTVGTYYYPSSNVDEHMIVKSKLQEDHESENRQQFWPCSFGTIRKNGSSIETWFFARPRLREACGSASYIFYALEAPNLGPLPVMAAFDAQKCKFENKISCLRTNLSIMNFCS